MSRAKVVQFSAGFLAAVAIAAILFVQSLMVASRLQRAEVLLEKQWAGEREKRSELRKKIDVIRGKLKGRERRLQPDGPPSDPYLWRYIDPVPNRGVLFGNMA